MIDIIIPAYNSHEKIKTALLSISMQTISDKVCVYIVNDASEKDYSNEIDLFKNKLNIKEIKLFKNSGPGVARQKGIDSSNNDFILFLDSDDVLYNVFSLEILYGSIVDSNYDIIIGGLLDEQKNSISYYSQHMGCLHGKLYRRSFIEKYNIKFNDSRSSEDHSFNRLLVLAEPNMFFVNQPLYVYKYNDKSITNSSLNFNDMKWYIYNMEWIVEQAEIRKFDRKLIAEFIFSSILYVYITYIENLKNPNINKIIGWMTNLLEYNDSYEGELSEQEKFSLYNGYHFSKIPEMSFNEFCYKIRDTKNK